MKALAAQLRVELILTLRRTESLLITIVVPVVLMVFFGAVAANPPDFLVPGLLALAVGRIGCFLTGLPDHTYGIHSSLPWAVNFGDGPRHPTQLYESLAVLLIEIVQISVLAVIARLLFGWTPTGSPFAALVALVLGSAAFAGLGLLMAGSLRAEATLAVANGLYLVFLLLGGFVLPLDRLPGPVASAAQVLPGAALTYAVRGAFSAVSPQVLLGPFAVLAAWAVVTLGAAALTFRPE